MSTSKDRTVIWVVAAVVLALVCCLCLVLVGAGASIYLTTTSVEVSPTRVPPESRAVHDELEAEVVPIADPIALAERLEGKSGIPTVLAETAAPIQIGTVQSFWAINGETVENFQVDAKLVYATDHVYFWVDQGVAYDLAEVKALVDDFETNTYPTDRAFF